MMRIKFIVSAALVLLAGAVSIYHGAPALWSPLPLLVVLTGFALSELPINRPDFPFRELTLSLLASIPITAAYFAWSALPVAASRIPARSVVLLTLVAMLSLVFFLGSWSYGVTYQGLFHTIAVATINGAFVLVAVLVVVLHRRSPTYTLSLVFHWALFLWLAWFAFPWLGELP
jgi:hypothetical protein